MLMRSVTWLRWSTGIRVATFHRVIRAERDLAVARLAADSGDPAASELFADAVAALRARESPYYLASGLPRLCGVSAHPRRACARLSS